LQFLKYSIISFFLACSKAAVPQHTLAADTGLKSRMGFSLSIQRDWCPFRGLALTKHSNACPLRNERAADPASFKEVWEIV
jgi:hypothetical protein